MAELQWSINIPVFQRFGFTNYWAVPSLLTDGRPANDRLLQTGVMLTLGNVYSKASFKWSGYSSRSYFYERVAVIPLADETQPNCDQVIPSVQAAVQDAWRRWGDRLDFTVVLHQGASNVNDFADAITRMDIPPDVVLHDTIPSGFQDGLRNRTYFLTFDLSDSSISRLQVNYTKSGRLVAFGSLVVDKVILSSLPDLYKTDTYYSDQLYLQGLAKAALRNNPQTGASAAPMPATRLAGTQLNQCMAGECPLGNLFTDAYRWRAGADIALSTSGGLRGPGWPAGPINVSDIWAAMPFANNPCTATLLGLTVWEVLNHSLALATFTAAIQGTSDRLLQVSGLRVTYNPALSPTTGRITAIQVWDAAATAYQPLERLRLYSVATDSFLCGSFDNFPKFFTARYLGETPGILGQGSLQDLMGQYLQANSPIQPGVYGRLVPTDDSSSVAWAQSLESCPPDTAWNSSVATCLPCPSGTYQPRSGQARCIPAPPSPSGMLGIAVPVVVCLLLPLLIGLYVWSVIRRRRMLQKFIHAPKSGKVTILFTDVQGSSRLWSLAPRSMALALDLHNRLIRQCIRRHLGHEVQTVGDSFMIATATAQTAIAIAVDIQQALQDQPFPCAIMDVYEGLKKHVEDEPDELAPLDPLWNGLHVRIGIHTGDVQRKWNPVSMNWDYAGQAVNLASRIQGMACGGQVVVSQPVVDSVRFDDKVDVVSLGPATVKGVSQPVVLYQVLPISLVERSKKFDNEALKSDAAREAAADPVSDSTASEALDSQLRQNPVVKRKLMTVEQLQGAVRDVAEVLGAALQLLPGKAGDHLTAELAKAWRIRRRLDRPLLLRTVVLAALPTMESPPPGDAFLPADRTRRPSVRKSSVLEKPSTPASKPSFRLSPTTPTRRMLAAGAGVCGMLRDISQSNEGSGEYRPLPHENSSFSGPHSPSSSD
eukprot:EG_transcript_1566